MFTQTMLLGLFKKSSRYLLDPPKVVYFWRIQHVCGINFGESEQHSAQMMISNKLLVQATADV